jgi:hypothetical protein
MNQLMSRTIAVAVLTTLAIASGCGSDTRPADAPARTPAGTDTSRRPSAAPSVISGLPGPVSAGTYRVDVAVPAFEITFDDAGWFAARPSASFNAFNLYPRDPEAYLLFFRPAEVYDDADLNPDPLPRNLVRWLRTRPGLDVGPATRTSIGGHRAVRFDARVTSHRRTCTWGDGLRVPCAVIAPVPGNDAYRFPRGERIRFWVLDLDGPLVISLSDHRARFDVFASRAEPVVESVVFD